jgi:hypothetical protein
LRLGINGSTPEATDIRHSFSAKLPPLRNGSREMRPILLSSIDYFSTCVL